MALFQNQNIKFIAAVLFVTLQIISSDKTNDRPVYELINEQLKSEDKPIKTSDSATLPYGNPFAGNSQQNAKIHAYNQQAMFNAERIRQHKAQSQRWMETPQIIDSYMRAYHESQESHQLALEQQQSKQKENKTKPAHHRESLKRTAKVQIELTKLSEGNAITKPEKTRNQRSYGPVEYQQYLNPKIYQTVYVSSPATFSQELTVKPNAINEMIHSQPSSKLNTEASESSEFIYPKYYATNYYESVQNIEMLNSLLNKNPGDQLTQFNALINSAKDSTENKAKELETPTDLYFYLKDPSNQASSEHVHGHMAYAKLSNAQNNNIKDQTPIKEEIDDVADSKETPRFYVQSIPALITQQDETATKNVDVFNPKVTNHILSAGYNPELQEYIYTRNEQEPKPTYQALQYSFQPTTFSSQDNSNAEEDSSEKYLHHSSQKGVQHLADDGSEISAYDDENLHYAANYEFGYRVRDIHSGNDFGHQEAKNGEETNGHYHVLLPDGRMQNVRYSAGPEGFHADISYDHLK